MARSIFRPCIDLHNGVVKQIVGGTLDSTSTELRTNFVSSHGASYYAEVYRDAKLLGGHVIKLGGGNEEAARAALAAWPDGLQVGGGIDDTNAKTWIDAGASKVIVTSWLFPDAKFSPERLSLLCDLIGRDRLVVDLSCRRVVDPSSSEPRWVVAMNRWQTLTDTFLSESTLSSMSQYCSEFLVHAADVEGLCRGVDEDLVAALGRWSPIACTYAGGGRSIDDLALVDRLSNGRVDLTFGSALDIFGGNGVTLAECIAWNNNETRM